MRIPQAILVGASTLIFSPLLEAGAGWTDYAPVVELVPTARHYYEIKLSIKENPSGCKNKKWFYQDYGSQGADKMFEVILEGLKLEKWVRVYVTGKCNLDGYSEISAVSIIYR